MPQPIEVVVAKSLADSLSRTTFTGEQFSQISASLNYSPDFKADEMATLRVVVVPGEIDIGMYTDRGGDLHEPRVHVVIAKRFTTDAELAALLSLRSAIQDKIRSKSLAASVPALPEGCMWFGMSVQTTFDRDQLTAQRVFIADIEVTYRMLRGREGDA